MTAAPERALQPQRAAGVEHQRPSLVSRQRGFLRRHAAALAHLIPLMAIAGAASGINMTGAPQRIDDEGTYVAQAYAVTHWGQLSHYTYWYDHPPLGWLQLAAWNWLTDAFSRVDYAVFAGREAVLVAHVVAVALLWVLARRIGLSRWGASAAGLLYGLSPLAVEFSRYVYIDNVAVPWALASFVLASNRRHQLVAFAGSGLCFGAAVLSKETFLLLLPFLVWQMWRTAHPETRRYTMTVAGSLLVLVGIGYIAFAALKGELVPGPHRVSLAGGVEWQLFGRNGSGDPLNPNTQAGQALHSWLRLDRVMPLAAVAAGLVGLFLRRLRPFAAAYLFLVAFMFRPGYLPAPYVIALIPLAALLVAAVLDAGVRSRRRSVTGLSAVAALAAVAVAVPAWGTPLHRLWTANADRPLRHAQAWLAANAGHDQKLLVDDAVWLDLVRDGFPRNNVVWYFKADTDPAVEARAPHGWRSYSYILSTRSLRHTDQPDRVLNRAYAHSTVVASFGKGRQTVQVRRIDGAATSSGPNQTEKEKADRAVAGKQLIDNPHLHFSTSARNALARGNVAGSLMARLAVWSANDSLHITGFPKVAGEEPTVTRHVVSIDAVDGSAVPSRASRAFAAEVKTASGAFAPQNVSVRDGVLTVRLRLGSTTSALPQGMTK